MLVKEEARKEYQEYRSKTLLESLEGDQKEFWSYVRETRGGQSSVPNLISEEGITVNEPIEKANLLNRYYQKCFIRDNGQVNNFTSRIESEMNPIETSVEGIGKLLREIDRKKAPGPEGIPAAVIKTLADELAPLLQVFYQKSLDEGTVPISWKKANVTPVPKKGRNLKPEDYRPISLTSIFCKIMEHIVASSVMRFLEENEAISHCQHGFR